MTFTVRIYTAVDHSTHTDTTHETADEAFASIYAEPLALPENATKIVDTPYGYSIFRDGICMMTQDGATIGDEMA